MDRQVSGRVTGPLRQWAIVGELGPGDSIRAFMREDWIGKHVRCPCHGQLHIIIEAEGPFLGNDPSAGNRLDCYWIVTLSDDGKARLWEDRKGVLVKQGAT